MGLPTTPQEAAPAYDDVFHDHPVNQFQPTGSASGVSRSPDSCFSQLETNGETSMRLFRKTTSSFSRTITTPHLALTQPNPKLSFRPSLESSDRKRMSTASNATYKQWRASDGKIRSIVVLWSLQPSWSASCACCSSESSSQAQWPRGIDTGTISRYRYGLPVA